MEKTSICLLFGGKSSEHDVSLTSASSVMKAIDSDLFEPIPILITRDGQWMLVEDPQFLLDHSKDFLTAQDCPDHGLVPVIFDYAQSKQIVAWESGNRLRPAIVFPILHGPGGEDGTIQGLCRIAEIPCVGADVLGSALGLDKILTKQVLAQNDIPVVPYHWFSHGEWQKNRKEILLRLQKIPFPLFVKPANCGSSVGISKVESQESLSEAIELALQHDRRILVEKGLSVRELECAVLGNDFPETSVVGEIVPSGDYYDYHAKYVDGSRLIIPAEISQENQNKIREMAATIFRALDCCGMARIDFLMDKNSQELYFNEINTIPGFTIHSMYPKLWQHSGISYRELITKLISLALEKRNNYVG